MSSNINRRISDPMFEILCRRVSIHDIFDDNEEHIVIDETDEDDEEEVPPLLTYQTFEEIFAAPMVIDESDEKIDKVSRIVIDETDEDEVSPLLADQTFGAIIYPPLVIDESDEEVDEVARIVIDETDEDDVSCPIVIDENHKDVGEDKVSHKECQENEPFKRKQLCPKLMLFKLTNKLEKIVSKIEKLELISCDLDSGITTEFDSCVMLRLQSVEVS